LTGLGRGVGDDGGWVCVADLVVERGDFVGAQKSGQVTRSVDLYSSVPKSTVVSRTTKLSASMKRVSSKVLNRIAKALYWYFAMVKLLYLATVTHRAFHVSQTCVTDVGKIVLLFRHEDFDW
jgi:hypothetical protein